MRCTQVRRRLVLLVIILFGFAAIPQIYYIIDAITIMITSTAFQLPIAHSITDIKMMNTSKYRLIPRIVHQIWKTKNVSNYPIKSSHNDWKKNSLYKNYTIKLWTDDEVNELIRLKYSFLYKTYQSYRIPIQRVDIARLVILHFEGGIYTDLDVYPGHISTDELCNYRFVAPLANNFHIITNHFLMAERNSTLLQYLLVESVKRATASIWFHYLHVFWTTGPFFITKMVNEYCELNSNYNGLILDDRFVNKFAWHGIGRSWQQIDGQLFNYAGDHPKIVKKFSFGLLLLITIIATYVVCRQCKRGVHQLLACACKTLLK
jgi:mannosyltransferase OCH1-like enzyme